MKNYLLLLFLCIPLMAFDYVTGTAVVPKPTITRPAKCGTVTHPNFNTELQKISADGDHNSRNNIHYVKHSVENCNGTKVLLSDSTYSWYLYDAVTCEYIDQIDTMMLGDVPLGEGAGGNIEPRWDDTDPNVFYYISPADSYWHATLACFFKFDITTMTRTLLYDFKTTYPGASHVRTEDEGEPSENSRIWAWFVTHPGNNSGKTTIVIYDKDFYSKNNGKIIKSWDNNAIGGNYISVSPSGSYVVIPHYGAGPDGCWTCVYTVNDFPNTYHNLPGSEGHEDFGKLKDGTEVLFCQGGTEHMRVIRLDNQVATDLVEIPCGSLPGDTWHCPSIHVSAGNYKKPGWGLVIVFDGARSWGSWMEYNIFMQEFESPYRVWRIGHDLVNIPTPQDGYFTTAFASISTDGNHVYWGTKWNDTDTYAQVYRINLPSTWYTDLGYTETTTTTTPSSTTTVPSSTTTVLSSTSTVVTTSTPATTTTTPLIPSDVHIVSYNFSSEDAHFMADNYVSIVTYSENDDSVAIMKSINPSMTASFYDNALTHGDNYPYGSCDITTCYYLLDTTGHKIVHDDYGWYLMDISNATYRGLLAAQIASDLVTYSNFDGVMLDDVPSAAILLSPSMMSFSKEGHPGTPPDWPSWISTDWNAYMVTMLTAIKTAMGSHRLTINTNAWNTQFIAVVDGTGDEGFPHANWEGPTSFVITESSWVGHLNLMISGQNNGKHYGLSTGTSSGTVNQIADLNRYCYATFLMGKKANSSLATHYFVPSVYYNDYYWYDLWNEGTALGEPTGAYFETATDGIYRREFDHGIVVVNPTANSGTYALGGTYWDALENSYTSINYTDHDGFILYDINPFSSKIILFQK